MFLHLSDDEKFIDSAWKAFVGAAPGDHTFVVVNSGAPLKFIRSFSPARLTPRQALQPRFLASLPEYEAVFLHSLNPANRQIVLSSSASNLIWIGWGFDYYHLISEREALWLPRTRNAMTELLPDGGAARRLLASGASKIRSILRGAENRPTPTDQARLFARLRGFAPVLTTEYELIRRRQPWFQPQVLSWNYGVHEILSHAAEGNRSHSIRAMVGNSATPECNHLDAFAWLQSSGFAGDVVCPLSYGNTKYRSLVIKAGRASFGSRFVPLTHFLDHGTYAKLLGECSHFLLFHLRQQGLTNVLLGLKAGKRVIMHPDNPLSSHLRSVGFGIDNLQDGMRLESLDDATICNNQSLVAKYYGAPAHALRTSTFLHEVKSLTSGMAQSAPCTR